MLWRQPPGTAGGRRPHHATPRAAGSTTTVALPRWRLRGGPAASPRDAAGLGTRAVTAAAGPPAGATLWAGDAGATVFCAASFFLSMATSSCVTMRSNSLSEKPRTKAAARVAAVLAESQLITLSGPPSTPTVGSVINMISATPNQPEMAPATGLKNSVAHDAP